MEEEICAWGHHKMNEQRSACKACGSTIEVSVGEAELCPVCAEARRHGKKESRERDAGPALLGLGALVLGAVWAKAGYDFFANRESAAYIWPVNIEPAHKFAGLRSNVILFVANG